MSVSYLARSQSKKIMKMSLSILHPGGFNSSKCKTWAKMTTARIKLLRNKREAIIRQMRRDVALLLESRQDATARIRVEHVIREQNMMAANEIIELFCEHMVARLPIISKQRDCPPDLKEAISSLIFASSRCSDVPELISIKDIFQKKYGKDFVSAAADLRPDSGVSRLLIEKLSARNPTGELKLKVMKEIAKEYQVEWDTAETEQELLTPPEERIEAPRSFVSASSLPLNFNPAMVQSVEPKNSSTRLSDEGEMHFEDAASAARAAAQSAKDAVAAAQAAAQLAKLETREHPFPPCNNDPLDNKIGEDNSEYHPNLENINTNFEQRSEEDNENTYYRRRSNNDSSWRRCCDIQFDESDCDEELEMEQPFDNVRDVSRDKEEGVPRVHPKLPDYDTLASRFESLKYQKSHL